MDPFALASHEAHEHAGSEHHSAENDSEPTRSPYAPTRAREPASAAPISQENAYESVLSRYAPKKARAQQFQGLDVATNEEVASLVAPHASGRPRGRPERDAVATDERYVGSRDSDPRRRVQPSPQHKHSAITRPDEGLRDLKRLEAAFRWIQREDAAGRIPSAAQLPPVSGLAAADARGRLRDTEILELRPSRSLEPERMAPPPMKRTRRHRLRVPLMVLIASICPAQSSAGQQELPQLTARDDDRTLAQGEVLSQRPETPQPRRSPEGETVAALQPSPTGDQAPAANKGIRVLDPEQIKLLMKQGEQLIAAGDVVTDRTVFQRAAEAGDADAAIALGATYDPNVLAKLGVVGVRADVEKARNWYQRAETLGSPDARGRQAFFRSRGSFARSCAGLEKPEPHAAAQKIDSAIRPSFKSESCLR